MGTDDTVPVRFEAAGVQPAGDLGVPAEPSGIVVFAHGSGSSRHSSRNQAVAEALRGRGLATLLVDLLTEPEEQQDRVTGHLRFDIGLLAGRVAAAVEWCTGHPSLRGLPIGLFGASTGAAAALVAATITPGVGAVVSRGGRPDLAEESLRRVRAPTLLIVGSADVQVLHLNRMAAELMTSAPHRIEVVAGATHLFEEPGALEQVARLAGDWFENHL